MLGGALVGSATSAAIVWLKSKNLPNYLIALAITMIPGLGVPIWLSLLLGIPYWVLASSIILGQACFRHCWSRICDCFGEEGSFDRNN